jgi:hypothetical protein
MARRRRLDVAKLVDTVVDELQRANAALIDGLEALELALEEVAAFDREQHTAAVTLSASHNVARPSQDAKARRLDKPRHGIQLTGRRLVQLTWGRAADDADATAGSPSDRRKITDGRENDRFHPARLDPPSVRRGASRPQGRDDRGMTMEVDGERCVEQGAAGGRIDGGGRVAASPQLSEQKRSFDRAS